MSPYNSTFSKPGKPLAKKSAKRVIEDREFAPIREAAFERDGRCMAPIVWGRCFGPWTPHHIIPGARDKTLRLVLSNVTTLCIGHHDYVHDHPIESTELGLLQSAPPDGPRTPEP